MLKFLFIFLYTLTLSLGVSAQGQTDQPLPEDEALAREKILNEYGKEDDLGEDINSELKKTVDSLQEFAGMGEKEELVKKDGEEKAGDDKETPSKDGVEENFISGYMNSAMKSMVQEFLKENPFSKIPQEEAKTLIMARLEGQPVGTLLKNNPRVLDFTVEWLRDKHAVPNLMRIVNKPGKVKTYGYIVIAVLIIAFFLNMANTKGNLFKRIMYKLSIGIGVSLVNTLAFYILFHDELQATLNILFKYIHL